MESTSSNTLLSLIVGLIQKSSDKKHTIWIKCDKGYFGLKEDLYLAAAYFPPQNSVCADKVTCDTIFDKFEKDLSLAKETSFY